MGVICTCGRSLHGKAGKHGLDVKKGLNMIDNVVEDLRKAFANYKKCTGLQNVGLCGSRHDAEVWLQQALTTFFEAYDKECS